MKENNLFERQGEPKEDIIAPLAARMRPRDLVEFVGQTHILGPGKLLKRAIDGDKLTSIILYGPPGIGKTALAHLISNVTKSYFEQLNAVISSVSDIRDVLLRAKQRRNINGQKTILFIDELHRFNKAQQDVLMPDVEEGSITLIGATTHNPFFSIVSPLISRSQVFQLNPLSADEILLILKAALRDKDRGLGSLSIKADEEALLHLARLSDGDARRALNGLELGVGTTPPDKDGFIHFTLPVAEESIQKKAIVYDRDGDGHYNTISAFIKSMRGSDPDAALYWLAKMLVAGEDPRFIARRIVICAAEDVGNADPQALVVANAALQISEFVGLPEARIPLAQAVTYIATAPKSNASYTGINKAMADVEKERSLEVPKHLRDASYKGAKRLGHGEGYKYAHDYEGHYVTQEYIPEAKHYYEPSDMGYEKTIKRLMHERRHSEKKG